jgi:hypothetical protein
METKTIKIEGSIAFRPNRESQQFEFVDVDFDSQTFWDADWIRVAPYTLEIEMPEGFDPMKETLNALQVQRKLILAENEKRLTEIDGKIQELMAIEHKADA